MSNLIVPDAGELVLQDTLLKTALAVDQSLHLRLYTNNYTPAAGSTVQNFMEATFTNYAAKVLTRALWNAAVTLNGAASSTHGAAPQVWTCGMMGNTIFGYYVTGAVDGIIRWAQLFDNPVVLTNGLQLGITPTFTGESKF